MALSNAKPADPIDDGKLSYGLKFSEQYESAYVDSSKDSDESDPPTQYSAEIFTKYPDSSADDYKPQSDEITSDPLIVERKKRKIDVSESDPTIDVNQQKNINSNDLNRAQRKASEPTLSLRDFITTIENNLVDRAKVLNTNLRKRRSTENETFNDDKVSNESTTTTTKHPLHEVHDKFFHEITNSTRPEQSTGNKTDKIQLNGVVKAVESTLFHSAIKVKRNAPDELNTKNKNENNDESSSIDYHVQKIDSTKDNQNLNLLNGITFKYSNETETTTTTATEAPAVHKTNLTLVHSTKSVQILPYSDEKTVRVQHQHLEKTVFQSNLAIFPTLASHAINTPLPTTTKATSTSTTTIENTNESTTDAKIESRSDKRPDKDELLSKAEQMKEKIAEVQAVPVIFSQF